MRLGLTIAVLFGATTSAGVTSPFTKRDKAFYLSQAQAEFIRPGVAVKILSAQVASDGTMKARFKLTDPANMPLDLDGVFTPGPTTARIVAAYIPSGEKQYVAYTTNVLKATLNESSTIQASYDRGGTMVKVSDGVYDYTFKTKAPAGFDASATHTFGIFVERDLSEFGLSSYGMDDVFSFVPNGSKAPAPRDIINEASCNQCHDPMNGHGGSRTKMLMCDLCHTPQTINPDTGLTMDMPVLIHKIHMGKQLPSVVAGGQYRIFHRGAWSDFSDVGFPNEIRNCQVCHQAGPKQADAWLTPNRSACGACHDNVNFDTGENHVNLPQVSDKQCGGCHIPQGELEFDASIKGAHLVPRFSSQVGGIVFDLLKVHDGAPGKSPMVMFTIKDYSGNPIPASTMPRLSLVLAGPASDYTSYVSEDATKASCGADGTCSYTFKYVIPADAKGTYSVGIEGRNTFTLNGGTKLESTVTVGGANKVISFAVDGSTMQSRRTVVSTANCNTCHGSLSIHGSNRNQVEMCVLCHNPAMTDASQRTAAQMPAEAIDFRTMIHKIHTGKELTTPYIVMGRGGSTNNFSEVGFPGDRRNCAKCHVNDSQQLPMKDGLMAVTTPRGYMQTTMPTTAACLSCHTDKSAAAHAMTNTSSIGEACATCHGPDSEFSLDRVHAR